MKKKYISIYSLLGTIIYHNILFGGFGLGLLELVGFTSVAMVALNELMDKLAGNDILV